MPSGIGVTDSEFATFFVVAALHVEIDGGGDSSIARALGNFVFLHHILHHGLHGLNARQHLVTRFARHLAEDGEDEKEQDQEHKDCPDAQTRHRPYGGPIG